MGATFVAASAFAAGSPAAPAAVQPNDLMLCVVVTAASHTPDIANWSLLATQASPANSSPTQKVSLFSRTAIAGDAGTTFTVSGISGSDSSAILAWRGDNIRAGAVTVKSDQYGASSFTSPTVSAGASTTVVTGYVPNPNYQTNVTVNGPATNRVNTVNSNGQYYGLVVSDADFAGGTTPSLTATSSAAVYWQAFTLEVLVNRPPNAPTLANPASSATIDDTAAQTFTWQFSDPDTGDSQGAADLQWWTLDGTGARTGAATTVSVATPNQLYKFAAGYFAGGSYEWQVRTYDALGVVGPWSASGFFTAATPTGVPTITDPTNGSTVAQTPYTVTWSTAGGQKGYQIRRVKDNAGAADAATIYYDSGKITDANARSASVPFETNGRYEHIQLSVTADGTLWSSWADIRVDVSYSPPPAPSFLLDTEQDSGTLFLTITNPAPTGSQPATSYNDVYVDDGSGFERKATYVTANGTWRYWTPVALRDYAASVRVTAVGTNGTTASTTNPASVTDGGAPVFAPASTIDGGAP